MKFEVNYAREFIINGKVEDKWFWRFVEADTREEAKKILVEQHKAKYIVSMALVEN